MASVGGSLTCEAEDLEGELCRGAGVGGEFVDGVVDVTGVRFICEMSKSSQSSVSWAVPTRLKYELNASEVPAKLGCSLFFDGIAGGLAS